MKPLVIIARAVETELLSHTIVEEIIKGYEQWKESMDGVIVPEDIARSIEFVYSQLQNVCIRELVTASRQEP